MAEDMQKTRERAVRIVEIRRKLCNSNNGEFASKMDFSTTYSSRLCRGKEVITEKTLEKILTVFPTVSRAWLYFGEGDMLVENTGSAGVAVNNGTISNSGTIAGTMNASSPDLDALIHTVAQLSDTLRTQSDTLRSQSDTLNQQTTQISRLIGLLSDKE